MKTKQFSSSTVLCSLVVLCITTHYRYCIWNIGWILFCMFLSHKWPSYFQSLVCGLKQIMQKKFNAFVAKHLFHFPFILETNTECSLSSNHSQWNLSHCMWFVKQNDKQNMHRRLNDRTFFCFEKVYNNFTHLICKTRNAMYRNNDSSSNWRCNMWVCVCVCHRER